MWKYMLGMGFVGRIEKPDIALLAGRPLLICYPTLVKLIAWSVL